MSFYFRSTIRCGRSGSGTKPSDITMSTLFSFKAFTLSRTCLGYCLVMKSGGSVEHCILEHINSRPYPRSGDNLHMAWGLYPTSLFLTLQAYQFSRRGIIKLPPLQLAATVPSEEALSERPAGVAPECIRMLSVYGRVYCCFNDRRSRRLYLYRAYKCVNNLLHISQKKNISNSDAPCMFIY